MVREAAGDADDGGDAELPGDDRGVALLGAHVDDDGGDGEEERGPRRIGDRCDQHIIGAEVSRIGRIDHDSGEPAGRARADAHPVQLPWAVVRCRLRGPARPGLRWRQLTLEPERWHTRLEEVATPAPLVDQGGERRWVSEQVRELVDRDHEQVVAGEVDPPGQLGEGPT